MIFEPLKQLMYTAVGTGLKSVGLALAVGDVVTECRGRSGAEKGNYQVSKV